MYIHNTSHIDIYLSIIVITLLSLLFCVTHISGIYPLHVVCEHLFIYIHILCILFILDDHWDTRTCIYVCISVCIER